MADNEFFNPTHLYLEEDGVSKVGAIIKSYNKSRVILVFGRASFLKSDNYPRLTKSLAEAGIEYLEYSGIDANPDIADALAIVDLAKGFNPDLLLAVGGGSVIDAAKVAANLYYYDGDPLDFNRHLAEPTEALPVGVVLTLAASGSEMSSSAVISDRKTGFKGGFNHKNNYPLFSILDPSLTYTVSQFQTACGIVDIIAHSFERYFCPSREYEIADEIALAVIKGIIEVAPEVLSDPFNYEKRRAMMLCGTVSHNGWTSLMKPFKMKCHFVEHIISGKYPMIAHGLGLAWLMPEFLRRNTGILEEKIVKFGKTVFDVDTSTETIKRFDAFIKGLPLNNNMQDYGISKEEEESCYEMLDLSRKGN